MPNIQEVLQDPNFLKLSGPDQVAVLKQLGGSGPGAEYSQPYQNTATGGFAESATPPTQEAKKAFMSVARPTLELGGLGVGGVVGVAAGSPTGPGAVATGVAGGAFGYGIGANMADRLEEFLGIVEPMDLKESAIKAGKDIRTGAVYELAGPVVGKAVSAGAKGVVSLGKKAGVGRFFTRMKELFPALSDKGMVLKAKEILKSVRKETDEMAATAKETEGVVERLKIKTEPTFSQKTGGTEAAAQEQTFSAKNAELMAILKGRDSQINKEALETIDTIFKQGGNIDDVIKAVEGPAQKLTKTAEAAKGAVTDDIIKLTEGKSVQDTGKKIQETLGVLKQTEKDAVSSLYDKIPKDITLNADVMNTTVKSVAADFKKIGGGTKSFPSDLVRQIKRYLKPSKGKTITFDGLRDLRSQIGEEIRESLMGQTPNLKLARRLQMLEKGIDDSLDKMLKLGPEQARASQLYREASEAFKAYSKRFKKGTVGEVLQAGNQVTGKKVSYSDIPRRFFSAGKMDPADDLVAAMGKKDAAGAIDDYAGMEAAVRLEKGGKAPMVWLKQNAEVLKKYGIYDKYAQIVKRQQISDQAVANLNQYGKTVATKVLGTDADKVIKNVFGGVGKVKSAQVARELLELPGIKNNPAALRGIQSSFKDFFFSEIKTVKGDSVAAAGKMLKQYGKAMEVIYKDKPKQMKALYDYHKLLQILDRNKNVTYAGNSATVEKLMGGGNEELRGIGRNIAQFVAVSKGAGWKFSVFKNLWNSFFGGPRRYSNKKIEKFLMEATWNPEAAETIMMATRKNIKPDIIEKRMRQHFVAMGLAQADTSKDTAIDMLSGRGGR